MTQPSRHYARTQLLLALIAIAIGGVAFALSGDFVVGVGVGAVVFAIARQAMKVWGSNDHQEVTTSASDRERSHR